MKMLVLLTTAAALALSAPAFASAPECAALAKEHGYTAPGFNEVS